MDKLIAKEVEFNGDIIKAAQDPDGNIWVGARWVCEAIGLDDNRIKYERRKMQTDSVISKGGTKFYPPYQWRESECYVLTVRLSAIMVG